MADTADRTTNTSAPNNVLRLALKWLCPKNTEPNLISAVIHMLSITAIIMSLVELRWFTIAGTNGLCEPFLTMTQFFLYGYTFEYIDDATAVVDECLNTTTVNMMRIIILLCFMAMLFSLCGFFIEIVNPKNLLYVARKYALMSTFTVLWILAIVASCYYVTMLIEETFLTMFPKTDIYISYGYGFYLIAATGGLNLAGTFLSLMFTRNTNGITYRTDEHYLIDGYDENIDSFQNHPPPPPYNIPPPPYSP